MTLLHAVVGRHEVVRKLRQASRLISFQLRLSPAVTSLCVHLTKGTGPDLALATSNGERLEWCGRSNASTSSCWRIFDSLLLCWGA
eukprot:5496135-Amphidinium_carterae.2